MPNPTPVTSRLCANCGEPYDAHDFNTDTCPPRTTKFKAVPEDLAASNQEMVSSYDALTPTNRAAVAAALKHRFNFHTAIQLARYGCLGPITCASMMNAINDLIKKEST